MITQAHLRELLAQSGSRYDGHVTNGSLSEQVLVVYSLFGTDASPMAEVVSAAKLFMAGNCSHAYLENRVKMLILAEKIEL